MSLIVDALRRAQEGTARRVPAPLGGARGRSPLPGLHVGSMRVGRMLRLGAILLVLLLIAAGVWVRTQTNRRPVVRVAAPVTRSLPETPPVLAVEPLAPTTPEEATPTGTTAPAGDSVPARRTASRPIPRRPAPIEAAPAPVPVTAAPVAVAPPTPAPVVEVHVNDVREGEEALAAGLRNQQQGDWARAIEEYRRGIASDPKNAGLFNNLGIALKQTGRIDEAGAAFEDALKIDPKYEKALNNLGVTRYQQGRFEDAIDLFRHALRVNAANVESYVNLGIIYLQAGRWDEAFGVFQDGLRYDPRSPEANYNLGLLWERRGDAERAKQHYERFLTAAGVQHQELAARVRDHLRDYDKRRSKS